MPLTISFSVGFRFGSFPFRPVSKAPDPAETQAASMENLTSQLTLANIRVTKARVFREFISSTELILKNADNAGLVNQINSLDIKIEKEANEAKQIIVA